MNNIFSLKKEKAQRHIGEYFEIIRFKNKYFLYYCCLNKLKLVISNSLNFNDINPMIVIKDSPGGCFTILKEKNQLYMLCGVHNSNKENNEISIPDLVWPKEKRTISDWRIKRNDRKNGMYLLKSLDGIKWEEISELPVLHREQMS